MSQFTSQQNQLLKSPQLQPQNSTNKTSIKINGSQVFLKEQSYSHLGTPQSLGNHQRKTSSNLDKFDNGNNMHLQSQQISLQQQSSQKEERQGGQIQKLTQQYKGINYKIGQSSPICILKVRPLFIHETLSYNKQMIEVLDKEALVFHSANPADEESTKDFLLNLTKDKIYRAHRMIPQDQSNSALYGLEFPQIIENLLKGISHSLLTYGAKDSGKTHSLFGTLSDPGLILYFAQTLFAKKSKANSLITIYLSVMKYDDDFSDLLCPTGEPLLFKHGKYGCYMPCITRVKIETLVEFFVYFRLALRSMQSRDINRDFQIGQNQQFKTERNHCMFRFQIFHKIFEKQFVKQNTVSGSTGKINEQEQNEKLDKVEQKVYESEMVFIDCDHYDINDKIEQRHIQQSIINLENIFQYIYEINKGIRSPQTHIPFDSTKFTNYYKNYLFGNNQLIFFGALSPYINHLDESTKTARMAQWAFFSRNNVIGKVTVGIPQWQKASVQDTMFLRKISHQTNVLGDEVKGYISNQHMKSEDKAQYLHKILTILKDIKHLIARNAKIVRNYLGLREDKSEYLKLEFIAAKHYIRTTDIRELYLIRALPTLQGDSLKQLKTQQAGISKTISEINYYFLSFGQIKQKLIEVVEAQNEAYKNILKGSHLDALYQLGLGAIQYVKWSQENAIRSYEAHEAYRLDMWMDEITTKIFTFIEHLISQMDIKEAYQKRRVRTYKKIPTQIALRSLKSMTAITQNDVKIQNFNKIIQEEENKQGFGEHDSPLIKNEDLPSLANHKRNHSFQFQRSPISGKYSPQVSQVKFLTPMNQEQKNGKKQRSSVLTAFHTFLNLTESSSNYSTPNAKSSLADLQNNNTKASIMQISNQKSSFFNNHPNKSTFNYFDDTNGNNTLEQINQESSNSIIIDKKQYDNKIIIINEQQEHQSNKKSNLLKKTSIEQPYMNKKKVNLTSFENIESERRLKSQSIQSHQSKVTTDKDIQGDEEDQPSMNYPKSSVRYSMDDLQRIDQELKEKKAKLKQENKTNEKMAEEYIQKQKDQGQQIFQNLSIQTKNQQQINNSSISANHQRDSLNTNQKEKDSINSNKRDSFNINIRESINLNQSGNFNQRDSFDINSQENKNQRNSSFNLHAEGSSLQLHNKKKRTISFSQQNNNNNNNNGYLNNIPSIQQIQSESLQVSINNLQQQYHSQQLLGKNSQKNPLQIDQINNNNNKSQQLNSPGLLSPNQSNITADDRFFNIIKYRQEFNNQNPPFNSDKTIFKKNASENKYYLLNPSIKKRSPFLQMDIFKNEIKLKSKIQIDDPQKFNSSFDTAEIKSTIENNRNILSSNPKLSILTQNPKLNTLQWKGNSMSQNHLNYNQQQKYQEIMESKQIGQSFKLRLNVNTISTEQNQSLSPSKIFLSSQMKTRQSSDNEQLNTEQRVKLPSLYVQSQHSNNDRSSFQISQQSHTRSESEKKLLNGAKVSFLTPQLTQVTSIKSPIDQNQISFLKKKNRQQQETLKQILLSNLINK